MHGVRDIQRKQTWVKGKKLSDLKAGDLTNPDIVGDFIYVQKVIGSFSWRYECEYLGIERGLIKVRIISFEPEWGEITDETKLIMKVRPKTCYLWGKNNPNNPHDSPNCHWLNTVGWFE